MADKRAGVQETDLIHRWMTQNMVGAITTDLGGHAPGAAVQIIQWGYNVTTAMMCAATAGILTLDVADYDDVTNRVEVGTITMVDNRAVGNTVYWSDLAGFETAGYPVAEGRRFIVERQVGNLEGGAEAGVINVFVVYRMTGQ